MADAQSPFCKIAKQLGVGTDTVIRRYKKLQVSGVIHYPSIIVDLQKCGYGGEVLFFIKTLPGSDSSLLYEQLSKMDNVIVVVMTLGDYDLHTLCVYRDAEDLMRLHNKISRIEGIKDIAMASMPAVSFQTIPSIEYYSKALSNDLSISKTT